MRGFQKARAAAWLFRLVFYGGSLTLIGLHFLGGGDATGRQQADLVGEIEGGAKIELWLKDGKVHAWQTTVTPVACGGREWTAQFWTEAPYERPSRYGFSQRGGYRGFERGFGAGDLGVVSSGTVTPDGDSARGVIRFTARFPPAADPVPRKPTFCDSGLLHWRARQP